MLGRRIDCPSCGEQIEVPRNGKRKAADKTWIPVLCRLCGTRMHAEPHQVGSSIRCPDCFVETVVQEAPETPQGKRLELQDGYPLADESPPSGASLFAEQIEAVCPHCGEETSLSASLAGEQLACPCCDRLFIVGGKGELSAPAPVVPAPAPDGELDLVYEPSEAAATGAAAIETVEEPLRHRGLWEDQAPTPPPKHPFVSGVYGFPGRPDCRGRVTAIAAIQSAALFLAWGAIANGSAPAAGLGSAPYWVAALFFTILAGVLILSWAAVAWSSASAIVTDSANGADEIESWPTGPFTDWFGEGFGMMFAFGSAAAAGVGASWALQRHLGWEQMQAAPFGVGFALVLAPIFGLSVLESGSTLGILSTPITASVLRTPGAWLKFHLSGAAWALLAAASWLLVLPWNRGGWELAGRLLAPLVSAWAWFVYCRLLGRLGWVVMEDLAARHAAAEAARAEA